MDLKIWIPTIQFCSFKVTYLGICFQFLYQCIWDKKNAVYLLATSLKDAVYFIDMQTVAAYKYKLLLKQMIHSIGFFVGDGGFGWCCFLINICLVRFFCLRIQVIFRLSCHLPIHNHSTAKHEQKNQRWGRSFKFITDCPMRVDVEYF